jgi:hypothetical protein
MQLRLGRNGSIRCGVQILDFVVNQYRVLFDNYIKVPPCSVAPFLPAAQQPSVKFLFLSRTEP